jgi:hypothetical protein
VIGNAGFDGFGLSERLLGVDFAANFFSSIVVSETCGVGSLVV